MTVVYAAGFNNIGTKRVLMSSTNGITWTAIATPQDLGAAASGWGIGWDGTGLMVLGGNGDNSTPSKLFATSPDGATWTAQSSPLDGQTNALKPGIIWAGGSIDLWVAAAEAEPPNILTSPDGVTWTSQTTPFNPTGYVQSVAFDGTTLLACGNGSTADALMSSTDGVTWTLVTTPWDTNGWANFALWDGTAWVVGGSDGTHTKTIMTSPDLSTWTQRSAPFEVGTYAGTSPQVFWLASDGAGTLVAAGQGMSAGAGSVVATSADHGATWTGQTTPFDTDVSLAHYGLGAAVAWFPDASLFVLGGQDGFAGHSFDVIATSPDGVTWTARSSPFSGTSIGNMGAARAFSLGPAAAAGPTAVSSSETGSGADAAPAVALTSAESGFGDDGSTSVTFEPGAGSTTPTSAESGVGVDFQSVVASSAAAVIGADIRDRAGNLIVALPNSFNRQWQELLDQPGSGQLTVQADDPAVPSIPYRSIMRFSLGGVAVFAALVEKKTTQNLAPGEEVDQTVMVQGRGTLAVFEEAAIWPEGGVGRVPFADTRNFDFTSGDLITAGWTGATSEGTQGSGGLPWSGKPAGWPDPGAEWIWAGTVTPNSVVYLRKSFAVGGAGGTVRFFFTADNVATVGLDGVLIGTSGANSWQAAYTVDAVVDGSTHHVSMQAQNTGGVAGALFAAYLINADGSLGSLVFRSDLSWIALANPATTPGFTPGAIVRLLTQEAQARGALAHVALDFTDASDSHGHAWPVIETSFPTGLDLMSALQQLSEYGCDWRMDPTSLTLRGYAPGSLGHASGVAFIAGGNLSALTHDGQA